MAYDPNDPFGYGSSQGLGQSPGTEGGFDWILKFGQSALESIPELVGIDPSQQTQEFRQDNPVSGIASQLLGTSVPYLGWFKAARAIGPLERAAASLGNLAERPFVSGALQEGARLLPFEAGRLAASQVVGDRSFPEMLGDTTLNLALGAGIGGLFHGMASAGTRDPSLKTLFPDLDLAAPLPLQARQMQQIIDSGALTGEALGRANGQLINTLRDARVQELPEGLKYIGPLENPSSGDLEHQLNRLFRVRTNPDESVLQVRKFATGQNKDFPADIVWKKEAEIAGLPEGFEKDGQFFRQISFKRDAPKAADQALTVDSQITKNMQSVGEGVFMTREADDGLYVMAKKYAGEPGVGSGEDRWLLFKTDQPGLFAPVAEDFKNAQIKSNAWIPQADLAQDGGQVYNAIKGFAFEHFPLTNYRALGEAPQGIAALVGKLVPQNMRGTNEAVARLGEVFKEYLSPRLFQFKKSWRANWIDKADKTAYDQAENLTQELMNGSIKLDPGKNLFFASLRRSSDPGEHGLPPLRSLLDSMSEADVKQFWEKVWRPGVAGDALQPMMEKGLISPEVMRLAQLMEAQNKFVIGNVNKAEAATGNTLTTWKEGHYGLSRVWEGDTRIVVTNDAGQVVAVASGPTRKAAQANARDILARNPAWKVENEYSLSQFADEKSLAAIPASIRPVVKSPSWMLERQDVLGFKWDTKAFTKDELLEAYENGLRSRNNYQANLSSADMLSPQLDTLAREDPAAYRMVVSRMNDRAGVQSKFGRWQNQIADAVLAPMLGQNSASRIVALTNTAMYNFQLGAMNLMYPVSNAITFVQTVVPEAAFVLGGDVSALGPTYSHFAVGGTKGPVGAMGVLSPMKLMASSMREMAKPSPELREAFKRAANDRVIEPRNVESYVGESATKVSDIRKLFSGDAKNFNFPEWLRATSEFLPAFSEGVSRTHAFTVGHAIARDYLKREGRALDPNEIYNFARQFTEKTMYLYTSADRPRVFTTPAGSAMGLFKNWLFHYMASMGEYAAEGFTRNNWTPLLWQTAGTMTLGGVSATPIYWAADGFSRMWANKPLLAAAYDEYGDGGDAIMLGLPAAITGISMFSQVNSPLANPVRDASTMFSVVAWDRMKNIGKAAGAAFDAWQTTGEHPGHNPQVRQLLVQAFAPTTIHKTLAAMNSPDQITSLNSGYPVIQDVSPAHRVLYGFGFHPVELDRAQAVSQELWNSNEKRKAAVSELGRAFATAQTTGNSEQMGLIMRQAMTWGVDVSSVLKSSMAINEKQRKDVVERQLRPQDLSTYINVISAGR